MPVTDDTPLFIPPTRQRRSPGLGGTILRAAAVMAVIDVAVLLALPGDDKTAAPATETASAESAHPVVAPAPAPALAANEVEAKQPQRPIEAQPDAVAVTVLLPPEPDVAPSEPPAPAQAAPAREPAAEAAAAQPTAAVEHARVAAPIPTPTATPDSAAQQRAERKPVARVVHKTTVPPRPAIDPVSSPIVQGQAKTPVKEIAARGTPISECRPYVATNSLMGGGGPVQGLACPSPNGGWRIVSERSAQTD